MYIQLHCTVCLKRAPSVLRKPSCWRFFECHVISRGPYTGFNGSCLPHPSLQRYLAQCTIQWERGKIAKKYSRRADPIASIREVTRSVRQELAVTAVFVLIFFFFFFNGFSSRLSMHMYNPVFLQGGFKMGNTMRSLTADSAYEMQWNISKNRVVRNSCVSPRAPLAEPYGLLFSWSEPTDVRRNSNYSR